ncbi:MAG TPA: 2,3-bisphosphoglycerate-dependent phosphoglycerate mutase [Puia sp.]|uniref:2,3-bisphosphoglycerate-dependent phosphoglycerate mutase n=1 Tax=Puia sp. TaxID=2045100 RepID=UPI002CE0B146|nr:2,3-bisphosphoglycerate-dependent phosphoglycerate mutase [Puia sp.]HVU96134.1 2,3-bisphosphoglycerate-dependent phosphoglycerate mutase [Puia sp.]
MPVLVLVRHGQSTYNLQNLFTGETDVPLTPQGREEAKAAGEKLKDTPFDHGFTSVLQRAIETMSLLLEAAHQPDLPVTRDRALNERNYGNLQGLNKADIAKKYGEEQVAIWRRSYTVRPPGGESLEDTYKRVIPYYEGHILPLLQKGENILVVAHGNSLRALMMYLEKISEDDIAHVDLATGVPRFYHL